MREYILTEKERKVVKDFIDKQTRNNHFNVLLHRFRKCYNDLKKDMELIEEVLSRSN